ncbi:hypothetical protein [Nonomuraea sp. CA-141351]|uniref:hypothetical protein n=1 Tax=Nonomuraea sp. CA-141351 TaxID=3239996 RepID=UPI003D8FFAFD
MIVSRKDCPEPARAADGFRVDAVRPSWKLLSVTDESDTFGLHGGAVASDGALWALYDAGEDPKTPVRWKGGRWERVAMPPGVKVVKALATSPDGRIWAVEPGAGTWKGGVREGDGWRELALTVPGPRIEDGPAGAHGGWVSYGATAIHWDGASWKRLDLPADDQVGGDFFAEYRLFGPNEETWAVPAKGPKAVRLRDGVSQVVEFALQIEAKEAIHDVQGGAFHPQAVAVVGEDETWVLGTAAFGTHYLDEDEDTDAGRLVALRHAHGTWTCTWGPFHRENFTDEFTDAVPDGNGGLWAAMPHCYYCPSTLWHLSGGHWTAERLPVDKGAMPHVTDLVATGHEIYALGWIRSRNHYHGALWHTG